MKVLVKKWGNSAAVRIPAALMEAAQLNLDQTVNLTEERGRIVIEAERPKVFFLEDLLRGISAENLHHPIDTGPPVGREVW